VINPSKKLLFVISLFVATAGLELALLTKPQAVTYSSNTPAAQLQTQPSTLSVTITPSSGLSNLTPNTSSQSSTGSVVAGDTAKPQTTGTSSSIIIPHTAQTTPACPPDGSCSTVASPPATLTPGSPSASTPPGTNCNACTNTKDTLSLQIACPVANCLMHVLNTTL
jgi:hypothetical protein